MDSVQQLTELSREKFWKVLTSQQKDIDGRISKLMFVKNIPKERHLEILHTVYIVACQKYVEYDSKRSSFTTWMTMWARAVVKNYVRKNKGSRSPLTADVNESDVFRPTLSSEDESDSLIENYADPNQMSSQAVDRDIAIYMTVQDYYQTVKELAERNLHNADRYLAVLSTMMFYHFDVSDRQIAEEIGVNHASVSQIRADIYRELGLKLLKLGIDNTD